jgi:hypothetical protein
MIYIKKVKSHACIFEKTLLITWLRDRPDAAVVYLQGRRKVIWFM